MNRLVLSFITLFTISTSFVTNLTNKQLYRKSVKFQFQITIINKTDNVSGGDSYYFGTWMYLDISMNGGIYNDDNFHNIVTENSTNSGGAGGSAGRTGDKDVFITPMALETQIWSMTFNDWEIFDINYFTFGTFYYGLGFDHAQLTYSNEYFYYMLKEYKATKNNGARLTIEISGTNGINIAGWDIEPYKF